MSAAAEPDPDFYRAAKLLMDEHGADAGLHAAERAAQLLGAGDMVGALAPDPQGYRGSGTGAAERGAGELKGRGVVALTTQESLAPNVYGLMAPATSLPKRPAFDHRVDEPTRYWSRGSDMEYDADAFSVAKLVIERHGANAAWWASQRVREYLVEKDVVGIALWSAIQATIEGLQRR